METGLFSRAASVPAIPAGIYLFMANNGNTRTMCETCSKLIIETPERRHYDFGASIVDFEQANVDWRELTRNMWEISRFLAMEKI